MAYEKAFFNKAVGEFFTPRIVLAWPNVLTARRVKGDEKSDPRFTVSGLIPKEYDISVLLEEHARAARDEHGKDWEKNKKLRRAIDKTADDQGLEEFAEEYPFFIKASAKEAYKPLIYGPNIKAWDGEASEIYSGRKALLGGKFFAYKTGKGGVSFGLNRVILLEHGEHLPLAGGGPRPLTDTSGFEAVDVGDGGASEMFE